MKDTLNSVEVDGQGWKFMSCSHCQELCKSPNLASYWLYKGEVTTNQKPGQQVDPTLDDDSDS